MKIGMGSAVAITAFAVVAAGATAGIRYGPCIQNVQQDQATVTWVSREAQAGVVEYGPTKDLGFTASDAAEGLFHQVTMKNLEPATPYYYRIAVPKSEEAKEAEEAKARPVHSFRTAPADKKAPFRFVVYGDTRTNADAHRRVLRLVKELKPDFVLHTGDAVAKGGNLDDWDDFFKEAGKLLAEIPYFIAIGNHENDNEYYYDFFAMPGNERFYSFDWGNCHFIALDTASAYLWDARQIEWLKKDLKAHARSAFTVVAFHQPPYSIASHGSELYVRETYCPIFEKYGVDVVFAGHDHCYQHCVANGVHYIVTGGGGAPLYDIGLKRPWFIRGESVYHAVLVEVDGDEMTLKAHLPGGSLFDTIKLTSRR